MDGLAAVLRPTWARIPKQIVVSLDNGITDPKAIDSLISDHGFDARVSTTALPSNGFRPRALFHPKVFAFGDGLRWHVFAGSANLTGRAMSVNVEAGVQSSESKTDFDSSWTRVWDNSVPWTGDLAAEYAKWRKSLPPEPREAEDLTPTVATAVAAPIRTLQQAVDAGFDPSSWDFMWVDVGFVSGGSGNQLEIPRGSTSFFGAPTPTYGNAHQVLADVQVDIPGAGPVASRLSWHGGNNKMLRLNLPTAEKGGEVYAYRTVLFRRVSSLRVILTVADRGSPLEQSWKDAGTRSGRRYLVGRTDRQVGFY